MIIEQYENGILIDEWNYCMEDWETEDFVLAWYTVEFPGYEFKCRSVDNADFAK